MNIIQEERNLINSNLKYNLKYYILKTPVNEYDGLKKQLCKAMGIQRDMLNLYLRVKVGERRSMSTDKLIAAAKVLGVLPSDLLSAQYIESPTPA